MEHNITPNELIEFSTKVSEYLNKLNKLNNSLTKRVDDLEKELNMLKSEFKKANIDIKRLNSTTTTTKRKVSNLQLKGSEPIRTNNERNKKL